jgi:hypothetical protein
MEDLLYFEGKMNEMKLFVIFDWMEELLWSRLWMEDE